MFPIFTLALTVSLDGLAAGFVYGARKIRLPVAAIMLVCLMSASAMFFSMSLGSAVRLYIPGQLADCIGALMLIGLGVYLVHHQLRPRVVDEAAERDLFHVRIQSFGLVIRVWHDPLLADSDDSGGINSWEATVLGLALALDAIGAGFGAAMTGLQPLLTACMIGVCNALLIPVGLHLGKYLSKLIPLRAMSFLPGILLIALGVWRMV